MTTSTGSRDDRRRAVVGIVLLYLSSFALSFGQGMVLPVLPVLVSDLDVSVAAAAQVITAFAVGRFITLIPGGALLDSIGARLAVIGTPIVITAATLSVSALPSYALLMAAMLLVGGAEAIWNLSREIAGVEMVSQAQRGRMMSGFMGSSSAGAALGSAFGGILLEHTGLRAVFLAYGGIALAVSVASFIWRDRIAPRAAVRPASPRPQGGFDWGALFNFSKLVREIRPEYRRTFFVLVITTFVMMMYRMFIQAMLPLYAGTHLQLSPSQIGYLFSMMGIVVFVMIIPAGLVIDKLGRKWAIVPSTGLPALTFILIPYSTTFAELAVLFTIVGVANGLSLGSVAVATYDVLPPAVRGRLQALRRTISEVGGISGPLFGGLIAGATNPGVPFFAVAPILVVTALICAFGARETLAKKGRPLV
jgi:MFS family permease